MALDIAGGQFLNAISGGVMLGLDPTTGIPSYSSGSRSVAFQARQSTGTINAGSNIIFDAYVIGQPLAIYDNTTGTFTAPFSGTYEFFWQQLVQYANNGSYEFAFEYNNTIGGSPRVTYYKTSANTWQTIQMRSQLNLAAGDTVRVRYVAGAGSMYVDASYNIFAGYMVR